MATLAARVSTTSALIRIPDAVGSRFCAGSSDHALEHATQGAEARKVVRGFAPMRRGDQRSLSLHDRIRQPPQGLDADPISEFPPAKPPRHGRPLERLEPVQGVDLVENSLRFPGPVLSLVDA